MLQDQEDGPDTVGVIMNYSTRLASDQFRSGVCLIGEGKEEAFTEGALFRDNISVIESIFCQH